MKKTLVMAGVGAALWAFGSSAASAQALEENRYGVCGGLDPACYNDWGGRTPQEDFSVLIYTRTAGPRHSSIEAAVASLTAYAEERGIEVTHTEEVGDLSRARSLREYDTIVFLSTSRDTLDSPAMLALKLYVQSGGGFVGIHNAFGTMYHWPWYEGLLGGAQYFDHGPYQPGTAVVVDANDASTQHLPTEWEIADEWYNLVPNPIDDNDVKVLLRVDESTLLEGVEGGYNHPGHGDMHPVTWCHYYNGGRAWLTTLGHSEELWADENFLGHVLGGILSAGGREPFCQ